jgi:hypothetical protein
MNGDHAPQPNELRSQAARSLLLRLFNDLSSLAHQEYQLVKTEFVEKRGPIVRAGSSLALGAALGVLGLGCLTLAGVAALAIPLGVPLAALFVGVAYILVAAILGLFVQRSLETDGLTLTHASGQLPKSRPTTKSIAEQEADLVWTRRRIEESLTALERKSDLVQPLRDTAIGMGALGVAVANIVREDSRSRN